MMNNTNTDLAVAEGTVIDNRYEVLRKIGGGDQGVVFHVQDHALDNDAVALKIIYPQLTQDETVLARLGYEIQLAQRLGHPNIVSVFDIGFVEKKFTYVTMELVQGRSLADRIEQAPLSIAEVEQTLFEVCQGLAVAHRAGVVHRDLRPEHILLEDSGAVKLNGFWFARRFPLEGQPDDLVRRFRAVYCKAPEQFQSSTNDPRVDIYALGIIAFETLTGHIPFISTDYLRLAEKHFSEPLPKLSATRKDIPLWLEKLVETCAAKDPDQRYQTVEQVMTVIADNAEEIIVDRRYLSPFLLSRSAAAAPRSRLKRLFTKT